MIKENKNVLSKQPNTSLTDTLWSAQIQTQFRKMDQKPDQKMNKTMSMFQRIQLLICTCSSVSGYIPTAPAGGTSSTPVPNKIPKVPTDAPHRGPALVKYVTVSASIVFF